MTKKLQTTEPKKTQKFFLQEVPEYVKPANVPLDATNWYDYWKHGEYGEYGEWFEEGWWKYWTMDGYLFMQALFENGKIIKRKYFPRQGVPQNAIWIYGIQKIRDIYFEDCWLVEDKTFLQQYGTNYLDCYTQAGEKFRLLKLDKNYKEIADVYKPLASIPKGVIWNEKYAEWQLGNHNEKDEKTGKWQSWDIFGNLVFEAEFSATGIPITKVVYKLDDEPNQHYIYNKNGEQIRCEYYRKTAEPCFPPPLGKKAYKMVEKNGRFYYFDKYDHPIQRKKGKTTWKQYLKPQANESAIEAYNRYIKLLETLKIEYAEDEDEKEELDGYKPIVKRKLNLDQIKNIEQKMGFKLPPSYIEFVTNIGLFETCREENAMFGFDDSDVCDDFTAMPFKEKLNYEWGYDMEAVLNESEQARINNVLPFSIGDESRQGVWYYCFDYNSLNPKTGEVEVYALDQDDIYRMHHQLCTTPTKTRGFDVHMQNIVQEMIEYFLDDFEIEE